MAAKKREKGKLSGLNDDGTPNAYWKRFKKRLDSYDEIPVPEWGPDNFLGHILKRYKDVVGVDFSLSYSGPPTKCKEIYSVKRMIHSLGSEDPEVIKKYIDWVFDTIIVGNKVSISSIAFFFTTSIILNFKKDLRKGSSISRTTKIPDTYASIIKSLSVDVSTYGDLAMAKLALESDPDNTDLLPYKELFSEMAKLGFSENSLNNI